MKKLLAFAVAAGLFVIGCKSGNEQDDQNVPAAENSAKQTLRTHRSPSTPPDASLHGNTPASTTPTTGAYAAIQAVFTKSCAGCHGAERPKAGLNLTSYDGLTAGSRSGPVIVAGKPDDSPLIKSIRRAPGAKAMPPGGALPAGDVKTIEDWVKAGAKA